MQPDKTRFDAAGRERSDFPALPRPKMAGASGMMAGEWVAWAVIAFALAVWAAVIAKV